jgi:hypothetical protein
MSGDPPGSIRSYMVLELQEARNGALFPAPEKEGKGTEETARLDPKILESLIVSMSSLPIELHYVGFEVLTAVVMKSRRTTQRYIPEVSTPHNHRCENLKPYIVSLFYW